MKKVEDRAAQPFKIGTVDDGAALPLARDQSGVGQDGKVSGHGVLRDADRAGQVSGGNTIGLPFNQQAERLEACRLRKGGKRRYRLIFIHISRVMDIKAMSSRNCTAPTGDGRSCREPDSAEDDLNETNLNGNFYRYLLGLESNRQAIIVENMDPPSDVELGKRFIHFSGMADEGRFGLFPL